MTISLEEAEQIVLANLPEGATVLGKVEYEGKYLFLAPNPDPLEGNLDPFFSVDPQSGFFRDFSPQDYDEPAQLIGLLTADLRGASNG